MKRLKNTVFYICGVMAIFVLANWGAETSQTGRPKPAVNFEGVLKTVQEDALKVENITFNGKFRQIPMFDAPSGAKALKKEKEAKLNEKTGHKEVILRKHPKNNFVLTKIDLSEVAQISIVPDPIYVYEDKDKKRTTTFLKITITSHDAKKTKKSYLIEESYKLFCDEKNDAGPLEKEVPLSAIEELTISDFSEQHDEKKHAMKIERKQKDKEPIAPVVKAVSVQQVSAQQAPAPVTAQVSSVVNAPKKVQAGPNFVAQKPVQVQVPVVAKPVQSQAASVPGVPKVQVPVAPAKAPTSATDK